MVPRATEKAGLVAKPIMLLDRRFTEQLRSVDIFGSPTRIRQTIDFSTGRVTRFTKTLQILILPDIAAQCLGTVDIILYILRDTAVVYIFQSFTLYPRSY